MKQVAKDLNAESAKGRRAPRRYAEAAQRRREVFDETQRYAEKSLRRNAQEATLPGLHKAGTRLRCNFGIRVQWKRNR